MLTIMIAVAIFLVISSIIVNSIPWYKQVEPMSVHDKDREFKPGEPMRIDIQRTALVGFEGRVTRELVHVHADGAEEEIYKIDKLISIDRGTKKISVYYKLPTLKICPQMSSNTYLWRGSMVYKPFGYLEKIYFFRTERFQIDTKNGTS
jgi:hypothetical protein